MLIASDFTELLSSVLILIGIFLLLFQFLKSLKLETTNNISVLTCLSVLLMQFVIVFYSFTNQKYLLASSCSLGILVCFGVIFFRLVGKKTKALLSAVDANNTNTIERLNLLENIIALMPGHVYWKNKKGVLLGCNNEQAKSIGLNSRFDIVGLTAYDTLPKKLADEITRVDAEVMNTGISQLVEEVLVLPNDEKSIWLSSKVPLYDDNQNIIGILGISLDVTEKKQTEQKLLETQQRLDGMILVSSTIAHELRTPLASLNLAAEATKKVLPDLMQAYRLAQQANLPVRYFRKSYLDALDNNFVSFGSEIKAAFTFIDMMLMKVNPAFYDTKKEVFSVRECINDALLRYPFDIDQRKMIHWKVGEAQDFFIHGEKILIIHIIFNLLKNALYHVAKVGKGKESGSIQIWLASEDNWNKLYFRDYGSGISEDVLPYIFERFFSKTYHGTGIGLFFCKMVMESLGGRISCESVEGSYTLFILAFPK